jgi:hypothetical protein
MARSDERARASVPHRASDYGTPCRTLGPIRCTFGALLLLGLLLLGLLLLGLLLLVLLCRRLLLRLCLWLGWRRRWWCLS